MGHVNRISKTGLELIKGFEGLRRRSDSLPGGGWIVGYGHTRSAREGVEVTEREAEYLLRYDLQDVEKMVRTSVHAPLNQNEFDALVSFAWNIGKDGFHASDVLKYVNAGEMLAAAESFAAWRKARVDGRSIVVDALVRRRAAEKNLFLSHPSGPPSAPSLVVKPELDIAASILALSDGALSVETKLNTSVSKEAGLLAELRDQAANNNGEGGEADKTEAFTSETVAEDHSSEATAGSGEFVRLADALVSNRDKSPEPDAEEAPALAEEDVTELVEDVIEDDQSSAPTAAAAMASIWDATDDVAHDELDAYTESIEDEDEPEADGSLDDSLLTAAIAASNLSRADGEDDDKEPVASDVKTEAQADTEMSTDLDEFEDAHEDDEAIDVDWSEVEADVAPVSDDSLLNAAQETENGEILAVVDNGLAESEWAGLNDTAPETMSGVIDAEIAEVTTEASEAVVSSDKKCIVDPLYHLSAEEEAQLAASGSRRKASDLWIGALPFILLAITGAVMCGLGVYDWWGLVKSDVPVDENQLYAGPFLTLIGGFGFVFGTYFLIRKLMGVED
jgi:GH24 family phage-related lysozyme (muramidase)